MPLSTLIREMSGRGRVAPSVDVAPESLDVERVVADYVAFADVFDHPGDDMGVEGGGVDLSVADCAVVGHEFHEDEVAATERGRLDCRPQRFQTLQPSPRPPRMPPSVNVVEDQVMSRKKVQLRRFLSGRQPNSSGRSGFLSVMPAPDSILGRINLRRTDPDSVCNGRIEKPRQFVSKFSYPYC